MLFDLSAVTDGLLAQVSGAWSTAPIWEELGLAGPAFTPIFSGLPPAAIAGGQGPQLSLFLYHVELNTAQESLFWDPTMQGQAGPPSEYIPLALNLYYLLTAYSEGAYAQEQQAMSVAMRVFHAHPIIVSDTTATPAWTVNLTMERRSYDEISLLWQASTAALRLSVVYRAAVVFLSPDTPPASAQEVETVSVTVNGDAVAITSADVPAPGSS